MYEPVFSPKTITASVGEQIQFVARFADQRAYTVDKTLESTDE